MANQPHPSKQAVTYRLDGTLVNRVKAVAAERGETVLALVTRALERELDCPDTGRPTAAAVDVGVVLRDLADDLEETRIVARNDGEVQRAVGIGDALDMLRSRIAAHPRRSGAVSGTGGVA